jgi:hypothetical protein
VSSSFLDRTVAARRPERRRRERGWDNPGRPGKGWRQLVSPSPLEGVSRAGGICHQFLWPESCPVSSHERKELCGQARSETAYEPSQAHGKFRPVRRRSYPGGLWLLLRRPERSRGFRWDDPARRPRSKHEQGAQRSRGGGERADLAKSVQPPHWGGVKTRHPTAKRTQPES